MTFGEALSLMKQGSKVARSGWNGKGMYLYLQPRFTHNNTDFEPNIVMFTAQGKHQPGWLASQADILADDWQEV